MTPARDEERGERVVPVNGYALMRWLTLTILILGALLVVACGGKAAADQPPSLNVGRDTCDHCRMLISEARFASGLVDPKGEQRVFDDLGEMVSVLQEEGVGEQRVWVHDFQTSEWLDGTAAAYAATSDVITPMGSGLLAFETREAAEQFMREHQGMVMSWDEVMRDFTFKGGKMGH